MRDPWALGRLERQMTFGVSMVKTLGSGASAAIGEIEPAEGGNHGPARRLSRGRRPYELRGRAVAAGHDEGDPDRRYAPHDQHRTRADRGDASAAALISRR